MKKHIVLFSISLFSGTCIGQSVFSKIYNDTANEVIGSSIINAFDDGYVVTGHHIGGFVLKIDSSGNQQWKKSFGNDLSTISTSINCATKTNDSCYVAAGNYLGHLFLVKLSASGDTLWTKAFKSLYEESIFSIQQTFDHGFIIGGYMSTVGPTYFNAFAMKLDSTGGLEWRNNMNIGFAQSFGYSIKQTPDSGYVLIGVVNSISAAFLIKLTPTGSVTWAYTYKAGTEQTLGIDFEIVNDGIVSFIRSVMFQGVYLMQTDFSGNIIWCKSYPIYYPVASGNSLQSKLHKTNDGGFVLVTGDEESNLASFYLRVDSIGNPLLQLGYIEDCLDVVESSDNGFTVVGRGPVWHSNLSACMGIVKVDSLGNGSPCTYEGPISATDFNMTMESVGVSEDFLPPDTLQLSLPIDTSLFTSYISCMPDKISLNSNLTQVSISPNPFSNELAFSLKEKAEAEIILYDVLSRKIMQQAFTGSATLNTSQLAAGIYIYEVRSREGVLAKGRVVKE